MKFQEGDMIRILEDPASNAVPEKCIGKFAVVVKVDIQRQIYTVLLLESNYQIRLLDFMMKLIQKYGDKSVSGN